MNTNKTTSALPQENAPEDRRKADGFLPYYSDFYFEKKNNSKRQQTPIIIFLLVMVGWFSLLANLKNTILDIFLFCCIIDLIYLQVILPRILDSRKICGTFFYPDTAVRIDMDNNEIPVSYSELEQEVSEGHIRYGETGLEIGKGQNKLVFHYEIGDSAAQKHVEQCYKELQRHLRVKLYPYEKKGLDLLDHKYFYEKSRRNQTISLFFALLLFLLFYKICGLSSLGSSPIAVTVFLGIFFGLWESMSIYMLFKNALLTQQNYDTLHYLFRDFPDAQFGKRNAGFICFFIDTALVILLNLWMILF